MCIVDLVARGRIVWVKTADGQYGEVIDLVSGITVDWHVEEDDRLLREWNVDERRLTPIGYCEFHDATMED